MEIDVSTVVDRPVATVWDFSAVHHVENHPRWDPEGNRRANPSGEGAIMNTQEITVTAKLDPVGENQ